MQKILYEKSFGFTFRQIIVLIKFSELLFLELLFPTWPNQEHFKNMWKINKVVSEQDLVIVRSWLDLWYK